MEPITEYKLEPKQGYIEVSINGKRTYLNIKTGIPIKYEQPEITEQDMLDSMLIDMQYRLTALELGVQ